MSGFLEPADRRCENDVLAGTEVREGRATSVAGLGVTRVLPTKGRRTVGAWCFVDLMGPVDAEQPNPMEVGPHPHIGLSTVTWLLEGEALHSDSLGTEQVIRRGQLNWMTAGHGIAHAELAARPPFRGVQMWVAQPEATRHGASRFEHHGELPRFELTGATGRLLVGSFAGAVSPAQTDTALVGAEIDVREGTVALPVDGRFEHAVAPLDGTVRIGDEIVEPGWLALVPPGVAELPVTATGRCPFPAARRRAAGRADRDVVELRRPQQGRDHRRLAGLARPHRPLRRSTDQARARIEAPVPPWVVPG